MTPKAIGSEDRSVVGSARAVVWRAVSISSFQITGGWDTAGPTKQRVSNTLTDIKIWHSQSRCFSSPPGISDVPNPPKTNPQDPPQPGLKDRRIDFFYGKVSAHGSQQLSQCSTPRIEVAGVDDKHHRTH